MTYKDQLRDGRWQQARLRIMERDGFKCRDCGATNDLQVHHTFYVRGLSPWEHPAELLVTVCDTCHPERQKHEQACQVAVAKVLAEVPPNKLADAAWWLIAAALQKDEVPA
jgi:5-methylcytosine-specific restriction endonuclease McrA